MTATATPAASTPAATGTSSASDELVAVAKAIYPYSTQYGYYSVCGVNGDLSHCPVTDRLRTLLTQRQTTLCGCQNPSLSMEVTATPTATGGVAHVVLGSPPGAQKFDLIVVRSAGALLVDDQE